MRADLRLVIPQRVADPEMEKKVELALLFLGLAGYGWSLIHHIVRAAALINYIVLIRILILQFILRV